MISSKANRKIGHNIWKMQYLIKVHDLIGIMFLLQFVKVRGRNCDCGGTSFWILRNGGITDQRR
jgi:hypothetical protein